MAVHFIIVHHLCNGKVAELVGVAGETQVIRKYLHDQCLAGTRFTDQKQILVDFVTPFRENILRELTIVEIIDQKTQDLCIAIINLEFPKFPFKIIIPNLFDHNGVLCKFIVICEIIFRNFLNSLSVTLDQIVDLPTFQFFLERRAL